METKEIVNSLRCCVSSESCKSCGFLDNQQCRITMKIIAANRLEELDAELEKRAINDRPYEWISVEDERKPKEGESCIVRSSTNCITIRKYEKGGFLDNHRFKYWMHNPALPKPKEPTFKDVFLKAFPKTCNVCFKDFCPKTFFESIKCPLPIVCSENNIERCWNQPFFEEEGEGE